MKPLNDTRKKVMNIRHSQSVVEFLNKKAAEQNAMPAALYRAVVNAGIEALYGVKVHNNQIELPEDTDDA